MQSSSSAHNNAQNQNNIKISEVVHAVKTFRQWLIFPLTLNCINAASSEADFRFQVCICK